MIRQVDKSLLELGRYKRGDLVVIVAGAPPGTVGSTNLIHVHRIGEDDLLEETCRRVADEPKVRADLDFRNCWRYSTSTVSTTTCSSGRIPARTRCGRSAAR